MKTKMKRLNLIGGITTIVIFTIIVSIYILIFDPELWDPLQIFSLVLLLYLFVFAHSVPDEDAKKKMS